MVKVFRLFFRFLKYFYTISPKCSLPLFSIGLFFTFIFVGSSQFYTCFHYIFLLPKLSWFTFLPFPSIMCPLKIFIYHIQCVSVLSAFQHLRCMCAEYAGGKRVSCPLGLELWMIVRHYMGCWNLNSDPLQEHTCSGPLSCLSWH